MHAADIEQLYQEFKSKSSGTISKEHFTTMLMFFPALLVVMSDGQVDEEEWIYIQYLSKFMSDSYKDQISDLEKLEELKQEFQKNTEFLINNLSDWEDKFLDALAGYVLRNPEVKEDLVDILFLFAEASDGESETEHDKIEFLKQRLHLA